MNTSPSIHLESPYLTRDLVNDYIAVFTVTNLGRPTMDQWFEMTDAWYSEAENRPDLADRVVLALHDFSSVEGGVTPYGRSKAQELVAKHPDLRGRSAIVIAHIVYAQFTTEMLIKHLEGKFERHVFHDKTLGLNWLAEWLPKSSPSRLMP